VFRTYGEIGVNPLSDNFVQNQIESNKTKANHVLALDGISKADIPPVLSESLQRAGKYYHTSIIGGSPGYKTKITWMDYNSIVSLMEKQNPQAKQDFVNGIVLVKYDQTYYMIYLIVR
jgi:hypothetical protein